jgi:uncharacterized membrane protein (UPF0127 family)
MASQRGATETPSPSHRSPSVRPGQSPAERQTVAVVNLTRGTVLVGRAAVAGTFWTRLAGLAGRRSLPADEGLIFPGTSWVHTCFMRFPIDLVFYRLQGREAVVLDVVQALLPWRLSRYCRRASGVLELSAGAAREGQTQPGDRLRFAATLALGAWTRPAEPEAASPGDDVVYPPLAGEPDRSSEGGSRCPAG